MWLTSKLIWQVHPIRISDWWWMIPDRVSIIGLSRDLVWSLNHSFKMNGITSTQAQAMVWIYGAAWVHGFVCKGGWEWQSGDEEVLWRENQWEKWRVLHRHFGELQKSAKEGSEAFARNCKSLDTQICRYIVLTKQVAYRGNDSVRTVVHIIPTKNAAQVLNPVGYGAASHMLILDSRWCVEEFKTMCDGMDLCE